MRISGHPVHPALVHFPIAFWSAASILDGLALAGMLQPAHFAWYCHVLGSVMAVPAMVTGWLEFAKLEEPLVTPGSRHMMLMSIAWICYLIALFSRTQHLMPTPAISFTSYTFSALGFLSIMWGGWLGGQLVYRYGAGRHK